MAGQQPNQYGSETSDSTAPSTPSEEYTDGSTLFDRRIGQCGRLDAISVGLQHMINPLDRTYDPFKDDKPIEELLARPRLPRSPYERFKGEVERERAERAAANEEALKARRALEFEEEKKALRMTKELMLSMKIGQK
jgi:hypothetical protein